MRTSDQRLIQLSHWMSKFKLGNWNSYGFEPRILRLVNNMQELPVMNLTTCDSKWTFDTTYLSNMEEGIGKIIASHDVQTSLCKMDDGRWIFWGYAYCICDFFKTVYLLTLLTIIWHSLIGPILDKWRGGTQFCCCHGVSSPTPWIVAGMSRL